MNKTTSLTFSIAFALFTLPTSRAHAKDECLELHTLPIMPSFEALECFMNRNAHLTRGCGVPPTPEQCAELNKKAAEQGLVTGAVAEKATHNGVCVFSVMGLIASICPQDPCANLPVAMPSNPSFETLECFMKRNEGRCAHPISAEQCQSFNKGAAEQGLVSEAVAEEATNNGVCIIHSMGFIPSVCPPGCFEAKTRIWAEDDLGGYEAIFA